MSTGTCSVHTWNDQAKFDEGDPPMGVSYDAKLGYHRTFNDFREGMLQMQRGRRAPAMRDEQAEWENLFDG
jgi:WD repeat-containing protein 23